MVTWRQYVAEAFIVAADGTGVRFDRIGVFGIDIRATERLEVNAGDGDDTFTVNGNLAGRIALIVNGGAGNDTSQRRQRQRRARRRRQWQRRAEPAATANDFLAGSG